MIDKKHRNHDYISIKYFMKDDEDELKAIFNNTYMEILKERKNVSSFIELFDNRIKKYLNNRED